MRFRAQGATQLFCETTYCPLHAQGATEYLVLLAVVLIVALVSVALLGFFPGMASDSQITQSQMYWSSASPIAIVESGARVFSGNALTYLHLRLKNTGIYPIRITKVVGGDGASITQLGGSGCGLIGTNISDNFYLAPGEEKYFSYAPFFGSVCNWMIFATTGSSASTSIGGASSVCQNSSASPGFLDFKTLGFEYIVYMEGQQITKRQIGKDWIVKCLPPV